MNNAQIDFFTTVKRSTAENLNLAQQISDILNISINEVYKKMRGESSLSFTQAMEICKRLNIAFSYQSENTEIIPFVVPKMNSEEDIIFTYLKELEKNLMSVHTMKKRHITITTDDIPLFHILKYPELAAFKLYFGSNGQSEVNTKFTPSLVTEEIKTISAHLNHLYLEIPSTEIWAKDTVQGTIEQVRYAFEAGYFEDMDIALSIVAQIRSCLTDIAGYAVKSKKSPDIKNGFNWFCCDVLGSISYLVESDDTMTCYNRFNTFNYLRTDNLSYCAQTRDWMQSSISKSVSFSGHGEKERNRFLNNAYRELEKLLMEISSDGKW